ncbi:MAG TPA: hypothetical protein VLA67_00705 [Nitrospiraceae bacterium]|nr:hypothetical protein [Nitrospiraceae bacterium]
MKTTYMTLGILCGVAGILAGCGGNYYKVNDPTSNKLYYTTKIDQSKSGAITFNDKKSGSKVTLQSSEVKDISKEDFEAGVKVVAAAPAKVTPAAAPAQAPVPAPAPAPAAAAPVEAPAQPADSK